MLWSGRIDLRLAVCSVCFLVIGGQEPPVTPKVTVEFRWVEEKPIEGLTEDEGFRSTCDPMGIVYPHRKPALVLTPAEVAEARLTRHDFSGSGGPGELYSVTLHLTKEAREKLAATCDTLDLRGLTVVVGGKYWGVHRYEKDPHKPLIADECRAATFTPTVGFFSSRTEADQLVDAFE